MKHVASNNTGLPHSGSLPFTGANLIVLVAVGIICLLVGILCWRFAKKALDNVR